MIHIETEDIPWKKSSPSIPSTPGSTDLWSLRGTDRCVLVSIGFLSASL